ncbi:hypothetical protein Tco_1481228, partial [Tanacetum coccineum]
ENPLKNKDLGIVDSGCSRSMSGNKERLDDFVEIKGGTVTFGGSLMYLTASRPDIMFAVSACSRHQVTPLTSNLNAVKKIFKYLKGQPKLGLWYPRDSPFVLEAYSDSDYAGAHGDRKSTTGGCQFLGRRLISWQCKKQTIVATSSTEAEYVAAANCYGQFLLADWFSCWENMGAGASVPAGDGSSSPPPAVVTDTTTTSLLAELNPTHPVGAVPTDETQDVSTPAAQTISSLKRPMVPLHDHSIIT